MTPAQIQALENVAAVLAGVFGGPAVAAGVTAAEAVANTFLPGTVGAVPSGQILPVQPDPAAHPIIAASGRAGVVPTPVAVGAHPASTTMEPEDAYNFPDIYDRVAALEAKLNAHIAATGMTGSAAMAAHP